MTTLTVDEARDLDEGELFERLGVALLGPGADPGHARGFGERWFGWKRGEIRLRLCDEETLRRLGPEPDPAAVAELLAKLGNGATVACAAVLVVRRGLDEICEEDDDD